MTLLNFQQRGSGPDLILIHGLLGSLENLAMVAKPLSEQFTVTSIDVRNHGSSFAENNMDYQILAQDIINLMDHLNIEKCAVLGHSMGGKIAMQLALNHPHRVEKLIVADIAPVPYPAHHTHILNGLQSLDLNQLTSRSQADKALSEYVEEAGVRQFLLRNLSVEQGKVRFKCHLDNIVNCYPQIMTAYQGSEQFTAPTIFIKGGNSDYILAQHRTRINELFPNAKAKIIQGAGHWLHAEKTVAFNKIVLDFLLS